MRASFSRLACAAALAMTLMSAADAASVSTNCRWGNRTLGCVTSDGVDASAKVMRVPQSMDVDDVRERDERIQKWEAFCQPTFKTDQWGVTKYVYKYPRCAFAATE